MEVRWSPYNSPFVPAGDNTGIYWIGREYRDLPHNAHVYERMRWLGQQHVEHMHLEMTSAVALLPLLDEMAADGVKAAGRRARDVRKFLSPNKSPIDRDSYKKLCTKKIVSAQV